MSKNVILANEIACIVILVSLKELGAEYPKAPDEKAKAKIDEIVKTSEEFGSVGQSVLFGGQFFGCMFPMETHSDESKKFFHKLQELGYTPKISDRAAIVDNRYLKGGEYEGFIVDIPPMFIDKEIKDLLLSYVECEDDLKIEQQPKDGVLVYTITLWGEMGVSIIYNHQFLGGGFSGKTAYTTAYPQRDYKKLLEDVRKDIEQWLDDHPGMRRKTAQA